MKKDIMVVISHSGDIDGIASAFLLKEAFDVPLKNMFFINYGEEDLAHLEREIAKIAKKGKLSVYISDLSADGKSMPTFSRIIDVAKRSGGEVSWFDHHPWGEDSIKKIAARCKIAVVGENSKYCATEIVYRMFFNREKFLDTLSEVVHYSDFNVKPEDNKIYKIIGYYALGITFYNTSTSRSMIDRKMRSIVSTLEERKLYDRKIVDAAKTFEKINKDRIKKMIKELYLIGGKIAMGFSDDIQSTQACVSIIEASGRDIGVYINTRNGKGHMRSIRSNTSMLAKALGGNGHPHASGFKLDVNEYNNFRSESDKRRVIELITDKSRKVL